MATLASEFDRLVADLRAPVFTLDGVMLKDGVIDAMKRYLSRTRDWKPCICVMPEAHQAYTRNLVDACDSKYNLLILVWSPGLESPIHDHGGHCVMKILQGSLKETLYKPMAGGEEMKGSGCPPTVMQETIYHLDDVAYISDKHGPHKIVNPDRHDYAVSLHLYSPPVEYCNVFDERTGEATRVRQQVTTVEHSSRL